jgi:hypothetical protein
MGLAPALAYLDDIEEASLWLFNSNPMTWLEMGKTDRRW